MVIGCRLPSIPLPAPFRVMASYDLGERSVGIQSEVTGISAETTASVQGPSSYYNSRHLYSNRSSLTRVSRLTKV